MTKDEKQDLRDKISAALHVEQEQDGGNPNYFGANAKCWEGDPSSTELWEKYDQLIKKEQNND